MPTLPPFRCSVHGYRYSPLKAVQLHASNDSSFPQKISIFILQLIEAVCQIVHWGGESFVSI
jgi:hypothetical protein